MEFGRKSDIEGEVMYSSDAVKDGSAEEMQDFYERANRWAAACNIKLGEGRMQFFDEPGVLVGGRVAVLWASVIEGDPEDAFYIG